MKLAIVGFGSLGTEIVSRLTEHVVFIADVRAKLVGKKFGEVIVSPGLMEDEPPRAFTKHCGKIVSVDRDEFVRRLEESPAEQLILATSAFARRSAEAYVEIARMLGIEVLDATPNCLTGGFCYPMAPEARLLIETAKKLGRPEDVYVYELISTDWESLTVPSVKEAIERSLSVCLSAHYVLDVAKLGRAYANIRVFSRGDDAEFSASLLYNRTEKVARQLISYLLGRASPDEVFALHARCMQKEKW